MLHRGLYPRPFGTGTGWRRRRGVVQAPGAASSWNPTGPINKTAISIVCG